MIHIKTCNKYEHYRDSCFSKSAGSAARNMEAAFSTQNEFNENHTCRTAMEILERVGGGNRTTNKSNARILVPPSSAICPQVQGGRVLDQGHCVLDPAVIQDPGLAIGPQALQS